MSGITPPSHAKRHVMDSVNDHLPIPGDHDENSVVVMNASGLPVKDSGVPITSLLNGMRPQGPWDASKGGYPTAPELGYFWWISVAGTLDGVPYNIGDWLVYVDDSGVPLDDWKKIDNTETNKVLAATGDMTPGYLNDKIAAGYGIKKEILSVWMSSSMLISTKKQFQLHANYITGGISMDYGPGAIDNFALTKPNVQVSVEDLGIQTGLLGFITSFTHVLDGSSYYAGVLVKVSKVYTSGVNVIIEDAATNDCVVHVAAIEEVIT